MDYSPNSRFPNFNGRFIMPDSVLPLVGTIVKNAGYDVEVFMEGIAPIPWERVLEADLVGFSAVTCNINRAVEMAAKVKAIKDVPTILGGPHGSMVPEHAVQHFDYVVREEGEETIIELLDVLSNRGDLTRIKGISYLKNGNVYHNPSRELANHFDVVPDSSLIYGYNRFNPLKVFLQAKAHVHFLETSRGCPYPCSFCWRIGGKKMRHRSVESVIRNIQQNTKFFKGLPNLMIILDSYFGVNREKTKETAEP
ncbi:MAG: cobalamin B12-binding domain-containing protein, partial [Deltaproteobacteria bacterium]|nr:cobalamin B12-binding domain-containing protein [Deltaproteobacteria bacterium]